MTSVCKGASRLSQVLHRLFCDSRLFNLHEWARYLNVAVSDIEAWLEDEKIPSPECCLLLVACVEESGYSQQILAEFYALQPELFLTVTAQAQDRPLFAQSTAQLRFTFARFLRIADPNQLDILAEYFPDGRAIATSSRRHLARLEHTS